MQHCTDVEYYTKFEKEMLSVLCTTQHGDSQPNRIQLYTIFFLLCHWNAMFFATVEKNELTHYS